jgi:hypothetical protein
VYADNDIMGGSGGIIEPEFEGIHPTDVPPATLNGRKTPVGTPQSPHPYHSPPSSTKYPPSSSSSSYYHPHQAGYSPSLFPHDDDMDVDSFHSENQSSLNNNMYNTSGDLLPSEPTSAGGPLAPRAPKDKLAKFFGEDTLLAAKRRDTILGSGTPTSATTLTGAGGSMSTMTTTTAVGTVASGSTSITTGTASTPTSAGLNNGSMMMMKNDKAEYLCADYMQNEIIFNMEGNVKGGTVTALVQRLTQHDQLGNGWGRTTHCLFFFFSHTLSISFSFRFQIHHNIPIDIPIFLHHRRTV